MDDRITQSLEFLFSQYFIHPDCITEIADLISGSGYEGTFIRLLTKNTGILHNLGKDAIKTKNFEKLKHAPRLYAMKFKLSNLNMRIIYTYKEGKLALLLCSFYERSDSKENYPKYVPIAEERMKDFEEGKKWKII